MLAHEIGHLVGGHQIRRDQALRRRARHRGDRDARASWPRRRRGAGRARHRRGHRAGGAAECARPQPVGRGGGRPDGPQLPCRGRRRPPGDARRARPLPRAGHAGPAAPPIPDAQNHPMWSERLAMLEDRAGKMAPGRPASEDDLYWYARMVAKLDGFLDSPAQTLRRYPESDASEAATLGRAVAWHRRPDEARASAAVARLIAERPDDPYYHELKGQFLLRRSRPRRPGRRGLPRGGRPGAAGAADPRRPRPRAAQHRRPGRRAGSARHARPLGGDGRRRRLRAARPRAGRGPARQRRRRRPRHRRALRARGPLPRFRTQRPSCCRPVARGIPGWRRAEDSITIIERVQKRARR